MDTEIQSVEITLGDDPRLIAGAQAAAGLYAAAGNSDERTVSRFRQAVGEACAEAFAAGSGGVARIVLRLARFADRIEVELRREIPTQFKMPRALGQELAPEGSTTGLVAGVDRIQREARNGISVTRLTKYLFRPAHPA